MNIKQLESFVCVVERGSFAAAAEALCTTQSTISVRIQELERHFGVPLFDRSHHRAQLTPKGEELLLYARQLVQLASQVTRKISHSDALSGVVRMGVVGLVALTLLPSLVIAIRNRYPRVVLRIHMHLTRTLFEKLREGEIDIALLTAPVTEPNVETLSLGYDHFVWMASPSLNLPNKVLSPRDLQQWPILGLSEDSHHYPVIERWFSSDNVVYNPAVSSTNMNIIAELTAAGAGVSLLPKGCYMRLVEEGRLRVLNTRPKIPRVEFVAIYKRNALLHPIVAAIASMAAELGPRPGGLLSDAVKETGKSSTKV